MQKVRRLHKNNEYKMPEMAARNQKRIVSSEAREESLPRGNMRLTGSNVAKVNIEKSLEFTIKLPFLIIAFWWNCGD